MLKDYSILSLPVAADVAVAAGEIHLVTKTAANVWITVQLD